MKTRAQTMADELQQVTDELTSFVEDASEGAWQRRCAAEQCTVAALACHIVNSYSGILDTLVKPIVEEREGPRFSQDDLVRWNAAAAEANAAQPRAAVLDLLDAQAPPAIAYVRALSDEQLDRSGVPPFGGEPLTAEAVIAHVLIGHPREHLASLQATAS